MDPEAPAPPLIDALEAITAWRERTEVECATQFAAIEADRIRLSEGIAQLEREVNDLETRRSDVHERLNSLDDEENASAYRAVVYALATDRAVIEARSKALIRQRRARVRAGEKLLDDPELSQAVAEYESFNAATSELAKLPPSYRRAIQQHHDQVARRLQLVIDMAQGWGEPLPEPDQGVAIVASIDDADGSEDLPEEERNAAALVLVLPIDATLYSDWSEREEEDLCSLLAFRTVAAATELAHQAGVPEAPIAYRSFEGSLTIQVWLNGKETHGSLREMAAGLLDRVKQEASEFSAARISLYTLWLPPAVLIPPEERGDSTVDIEMPEDSSDEEL